MKNVGISIVLFFLILILVGVIEDQYRYHPYGYGELKLSVAGGGQILFRVVDKTGNKKKPRTHCLFSLFYTDDKPGEAVKLQIDQIGTKSHPEMKRHISSEGKTATTEGASWGKSYYSATGITGLELTDDEPVRVIGTLSYKGVDYNFDTEIQLKHWVESRGFIEFCV